MKTFKQQIENNCAEIANRVLSEMQKSEHLMCIRTGENKPTKHPALYRWWFPKDSIVIDKMKEYLAIYPEDERMAQLLNHGLVEKKIADTMYCVLYFGKSSNGQRRIYQHAHRNVHDSTLRQTIYGLCVEGAYDPAKEYLVTEILQDCYCEWIDFPDKEEGKLIECLECICIALGKYPLNMDGNPAISNKWREYVTNKRKLK